MNKKKEELPVENAIEAQKKRTWINPDLSDWNTKNLENGPGPGPDGGAAQTYVA